MSRKSFFSRWETKIELTQAYYNWWFSLVFGIIVDFPIFLTLYFKNCLWPSCVCWKGQPLIYFPRNSVIWWQSILTSIEVKIVKISFFFTARSVWHDFYIFPLNPEVLRVVRVTHRAAIWMSGTSVRLCRGSVALLRRSVTKLCEDEKLSTLWPTIWIYPVDGAP